MTVFPKGTLIWQRFTNVSCLRTYYGKKGSFDPERENLWGGGGSICLVNLLEAPQVIVFFYYMIELLRLFQKRSFVLSSKHENHNVVTISTLLEQFILSLKEELLLAFHSVCHVLKRHKTTSLGNKML